MADLDFNLAAGIGDHGRDVQQWVFTKTAWQDDWVLRPGLWADRMTWACQPDVPSANLFWRYGFSPIGSGLIFTRLTGVHFVYVKIVIGYPGDPEADPPIPPNLVAWYGTIENENHQPWGDHVPDFQNNPVAAGEQILTAYGLEILLDDQLQMTTWMNWLTEPRRAIPFNEVHNDTTIPNRGAAKPLGQPAYAFDLLNGVLWTTRDCVEHVIYRLDTTLPFTVKASELNKVQNWDAPTVERHGMSVRETLNQLLGRQRLYTWWLQPRYTTAQLEDPDHSWTDPEEEIEFKIATMTDVPVQIGPDPAHVVPANSRQHKIIANAVPDVQINTATSSTDAADIVLVQGARRRVCFSVRPGHLVLFNAAWTQAEQDAYEEGGSTDPNYPPADELQARRDFTNAARKASALSKVYRLFSFDPEFIGEVGGVLDNLNGYAPSANLDPINDFNVDTVVGFSQYYPTLELLPSLFLRKGYDYSGTRIKDGLAEDALAALAPVLAPFAIVADQFGGPHYARPLEAYGLSSKPVEDEEDSREWSAELRVSQRTVEVIVHGAPQHIIGLVTFTPLPDVDEEQGQIDYRDIVFTLACETNRHAMGRWPQTGVVRDSPRVLLIDAGDSYRRDLVCRDTVVGLTVDAMNRGLNADVVTEGGWLRNDEPELTKIARAAWNWYNRIRQVLQFICSYRYPCGAINVGDMIAEVELHGTDEPIRSTITFIEILCPRSVGIGAVPESQPVKYTLQTSFAQFDYQRAIL